MTGALTSSRSGQPRFSIVTAVHNVEPYLPDFIASIEGQQIPESDLEVIAVDDGSTDGSRGLLEDWARQSQFRIRTLSQPNQGQGAARNLGLDQAAGRWVTFTDPDDMLDPGFLGVATRFAQQHPDVEIMSAKSFVLDDGAGTVSDTHPRREQYRRGNRIVDLLAEPNVFPGSATVSLFRLDRLRAAGIHFDPRVRPNFEDGHFTAHYVLAQAQPIVGLLGDAHYIYRRRSAGTSTLQRSLAHPGRFTDVLEHGYLEVTQAAIERHGRVPDWLQHLLIYELSWYLSADEKIATDIVLPSDIEPVFHDLFGRNHRRARAARRRCPSGAAAAARLVGHLRSRRPRRTLALGLRRPGQG